MRLRKEVPSIDFHPLLPTFPLSCYAPFSVALLFVTSMSSFNCLTILFRRKFVVITFTNLAPVSAGFSLGSLFDPEDGYDTFLWNLGWFSPHYVPLCPKRQTLYINRITFLQTCARNHVTSNKPLRHRYFLSPSYQHTHNVNGMPKVRSNR
jgi:hypothetical protein